jgi:Uma2 family endonuclease
MTTATAIEPRVMTADEFMQFHANRDGESFELIRGEIVTMTSSGGRHGWLLTRIGMILMLHVDEHKLGFVISDGGTKLERDPDTVRRPDVAFYSNTRIAELPDSAFDIAPDLAVEIRSPSDRPGSRMAKIREYLAAGVKIVWDVNPIDLTVTVYVGNTRGQVYHVDDTLDGGDVLPGFSCPVARIFR